MKELLISQLTPAGCWKGKLSSSALATATAVFAISSADFSNHRLIIRSGLNWLADNINTDGGFGDTPDSESNLSTSLIVWAAFSLSSRFEKDFSGLTDRIENFIKIQTGSLDPGIITEAVLRHYGDDRTFSVPILTMCAAANRLGDSPDCWAYVPQLPFELSLLPHSFFQVFRLPVVSYAMPALISMGIVRHRKRPSRWPLTRFLRSLAKAKALKLLTRLLPSNGGFLEAVPLTSFVIMSLSTAGAKNHPSIKKGMEFLLGSVREDGSWPIDTNLSTWLTTLAVKALPTDALTVNQKKNIREWLLDQQYTKIHPFTNATPGGWGWTDLPGAVPDADDTAGAIIALKKLIPNYSSPDKEESALTQITLSVINGIKWLINLQNSDGGIPAFCRGRGKLPFDRSCPDISAHVLQAFTLWREELPGKLHDEIDSSSQKILNYLKKNQRPDGSWIPLWFGNQNHPDKINPVFGTAQVIIALNPLIKSNDSASEMASKGCEFLRNSQNPDNGWGVKIKASQSVISGTSSLSFVSSFEETALAITALAGSDYPSDNIIVKQGMEYINSRASTENMTPAPIGLYFASLWYSEKLYPIIFSVQAQRAMSNQCL